MQVCLRLLGATLVELTFVDERCLRVLASRLLVIKDLSLLETHRLLRNIDSLAHS